MSEDPHINKSQTEEEWRMEAINILADLTHSLRNPFSTIQSYLNILEMDDYNYSPEALKDITKILRETVEKSFKHIDERIAVLKKQLG
jgi:signal transduction histidine kinase